MSRELASTQTGQLSVPADGNWYANLTFRVPQDQNGDGTVLDSQGVLEWSSPITYSLGGLDGRQAQRTQAGVVRILANGVTALGFRRQAATPSVLEINLTVLKGGSTTSFTQQASLGTRVRLRNG